MSKKTYPIIGTKSSILWDEDTDAWVYISGEPVRDEDPRKYYQIIPTLFRAIDIRANAVANLPWVLMKGETEFETSETFENKTGLVGSFFTMLYLIESSLVMAGQAYWKREKNLAGYDKLRHLDPTSMKLDERKAQTGELVWKRNENGITKEYTTEEIIYLWYPDPYVEIGPPSSWPAKSAMNACGVLANLDEFAKSYFGRGAIKAMLFSMTGASRETAEEFETWWGKFVTGIQNAFRTKVMNAEKVEPIIVGEGIKELENVTLSQEKREEIALSLGIPMSMLFADAANYATANQDKRNWYEDKIIPESNLIASILNEQVFEELGLKLKFLPETISIMQDDEKERAMALGYYVNAEVPLDIALDLLGVDLDDEQKARIAAQVAKKEEQAEELTDNLIEGGQQNQGAAFQPEDPKENPESFQEKAIDDTHLKIGRELYMWRNKCEAALKRGERAADVDFIPVAIPGSVFERVSVALDSATADSAVRRVFQTAMIEPEFSEPDTTDPLAILAYELKRANDILLTSTT